jgi:16S rRNA (uracil1498-N3)-methyltransferase
VTAPLFLADAGQLASAEVGSIVSLDGPEGHHAAAARRLTVGETLGLGDGAGLICAAEVVAVRGHALDARVLSRVTVSRAEPRITVVQALAKGDRDERAVEVMAEVGVDVIVPWQAARSIVRWDAARAEKGLARWRATAREAAKQARRPWLVDVAPLETTGTVAARLAAAVAAGGLAVVLHESATTPLSQLEIGSAPEVLLVVGPEGGIADDELAAFEAAGARTYRLGPTVLRTSTAGTVAATAVLVRSARWS